MTAGDIAGLLLAALGLSFWAGLLLWLVGRAVRRLRGHSAW
jgi:hypothetical protein